MTFKDDLLNQIEGDIRFDEVTRKIYSVDASIYEVEPLCVVIPKTTNDLIKAVQTASKHQIPIIARGAATGTTGGCLGKGLIIDTSKYLNKILEINFEKGFVILEPGVIQDDLNRALSEKGYRLGPNTSTGNRATIGGMFGNNAAGSHSLVYGQMGDHVLEVDLVLSTGEMITFGKMSPNDWKEKEIYRKLLGIRENYKDVIENEFPKIKRRSSGYNIDCLVKDGNVNLCQLLAGSEGSLGVAAKFKLKIVPKPKKSTLFAIYYSDLLESMKSVETILSYSPSAIELIDRDIIERGKTSPTMKNRLSWLQGDPAAVIIVEFSGDNKTFKNAFEAKELNEEQTSDIWAVRKAGLELLLSKRSYQRAIAFIEDLTIPPNKLASFMEEFLQILSAFGRTAGIYGHVGESCLHIRPYINLMKEDDLELMQKMMHKVSSLVLENEGVMSGEHGDGLVRSWLNKKMFSPGIYEVFCKIKSIFDPYNLMNPGKVVDGFSFTENLRSSPKTNLTSFDTFLDFSKEGGFELAVDMCNGNGLCRKKEGLMCPSFQATDDEYDTTRARSQILRSIIHGRLKPKSLSHQGVQDVLDLCLECKGCKKECPSQVDMAKMKSETLFQYYKKNRVPLRSRLFGHIGELNRIGSRFPKLFNFLSPLLPRTALSIAKERPLPKLAHQRFSDWYKGFKQPETCKKHVVLFNDTFTEFNHPEIGIAAIKVLNALGFKVSVPRWSCCGRPLISKGLLAEAKEKSEKLIHTLLPFVKEGLPIIVLEPSCLSVFQDELDSIKTNSISRHCISFDRFLNERISALDLKELPFAIKLHGHCHQKALEGTDSTLNILSSIPGSKASEIPSGCCGMAGSFGYEKEHYDLSMKIGELKLFKAVRNSGKQTLIAANGTSCRAQILHGTGIKAYHLAEIVNMSLNFNNLKA